MKESPSIVQIAQCQIKSGLSDEALQLLSKELGETLSEENRATLFKEIASTEKELGDKVMEAVALEKVTEYEPEDSNAAFAAAYAQSQCEYAVYFVQELFTGNPP